MAFEIDHFFICTEVGALEADALIRFGLTEGASNRHRGQGTTNRHFFFHNASLELIWVHDLEEACSAATRRTRLFERWHQRASGACPFGLCVRPSGSEAALRFNAWSYAPSYLRAPWSIHIAENSDNLREPMLFCIRGGVRPDKFAPAHTQPLRHGAGFREITRLRWLRPAELPLSPELHAVVENGLIECGAGESHVLEIGFDHERQRRSATFVPSLPISFFW